MEGKVTHIGLRCDLYWSLRQPILVRAATYIGPRVDLYSFAQRPIQVVIPPPKHPTIYLTESAMQRRTKSEEMVGIVDYTSREAKPRDSARQESLFIAVHRRSIIRPC